MQPFCSVHNYIKIRYVHSDERTVCPALCCLHKKKRRKKIGGAMATPTNQRVGNPPHDLFTVDEKSGE